MEPEINNFGSAKCKEKLCLQVIIPTCSQDRGAAAHPHSSRAVSRPLQNRPASLCSDSILTLSYFKFPCTAAIFRIRIQGSAGLRV